MASVVTGKGEERNSFIVNRKKSGTKQRMGPTSSGQGSLSLEGRIRAERDKAIQERQNEIEKVIEMHDSLIREAFHLQHFVSLVTFDPVAARMDTSVVFQQYKSSYDLLSQAPTSSVPIRQTRRAHTERLQLLKGEVGPSPSAKSKPEVPVLHPHEADIWDILASAKGKGKEKEKTQEKSSQLHSSSTAPSRKEKKTLSTSRTHVSSISDDLRHVAPMSSSSRISPSKHNEVLTPSTSKRKKSDISSPTLGVGRLRGESSSSARRRADSFSAEDKTRHLPTRNAAPRHLTTPQTTIKRIKLLVRPPPPTFSHPRQRPPVPKFGGSLGEYLSSYTTVGDKDLYDSTSAESFVKAEAAIHDRIAALKSSGRLLFASESTSEGLSRTGGGKQQVPLADPWSRIVDAVVVNGKIKKVDGKSIAAQIAGKVKVYWDTFAAREDRAKLMEEKRLRAMAKSTVRLVVAEWKKVVFHIRDQERQRAEAEEVRKGHAHLDAILDQSGVILETQHVDLSKGDYSRPESPSPSVSERTTWSSGDEGDSGDDAGYDDANVENNGGENSSGEDESGEESSRLLLNGHSELSHYRSSRSPSISIEIGDSDSVVVASELVQQDLPTHADIASTPVSEEEFEDEDASSFRSHSPAITDLYRQAIQMDENHSQHSDLGGSVESLLPTASTSEQPTDSIQIYMSVDRASVAITSAAETPHTKVNVDIPSSPSSLVVDGLDGGPGGDPDHSETQVDVPALLADNQADGDNELNVSAIDSEVDVLAPNDIDPSGNAISTMDEPEAEVVDESHLIPNYLKPFAVALVEWNPDEKVKPPLLLRGILRPYQQAGLEWLASLHINNLNGILADEMGLGKTIQTIALLAHLACDRGIWGPHLIVVPTSVLLNWEMEFKKFLPGFKILCYHGSTKRRKELRQGWNDKQRFNVCVTSYALASRDAHIFKRKAWYYFILDEAHMIKNFKSQRWNILLMFRSFRRLLLTGTPLQNNLTELWALLQFLMSGTNFANLKEFGEWFSNPLEKAIEMGTMLEDETMQRVSKLHTVLRPYLLRRLKKDVEKELPSKYEHLVLCPLSKRQRFLYDEFMSRAQTRDALQSGIYQRIANILMQLRKVCNHPDLFEVRPVATSFAMERSAIADFEIKELLIRRKLLNSEDSPDLDVLGLRFIDRQDTSFIAALESRRLDATPQFPLISDLPAGPPPHDTRTIAGFRAYADYQRGLEIKSRWTHMAYINRRRCNRIPVYSTEMILISEKFYTPNTVRHDETPRPLAAALKSLPTRAQEMKDIVEIFTFVTPSVVALDMPRIALAGPDGLIKSNAFDVHFDEILHHASVKQQVVFPDPSLLQYDCGKLQELNLLLREKKKGGHRALIFTQMTRILDILEIFLNFHGYLYLRLDGATKIEDRQYITERFNADARIFCFIASSRSGGVGINLTGADTVIFYDSDFNPQMDKQCEDRAHRIGQIRDVHIYRFISQHTVEEAMLTKANQKRFLDDLVIQKGEFDWRSLFGDELALTKALGEFEDRADADAAVVAAREEFAMEGVDAVDFGDADVDATEVNIATRPGESQDDSVAQMANQKGDAEVQEEVEADGSEESGGTIVDYMLAFVRFDWDSFRDLRV